jgi:acyl-coenzyme A synthetase/AMP-(fatty) acid ligase
MPIKQNDMQTFPLVSHATLNNTSAWRNGECITVRQFLADVTSLAGRLPAAKHILNVCHDRYHFAVGFAAALVSHKINLLPPTHTAEMVQQLQTFAADVFCLHDTEECNIALPKLCYSVNQRPEANLSALQPSIPCIAAQQIAAIVFTSGSTGTPLPYAKSWGSLVQNVQAQATRLGLKTGVSYTMVGTIPPQHMYGFESTVLLPLQSGNALHSSQPFYPLDIADTLTSTPSERILVSTPLHLRLLLDAELQLPPLCMVLSATAPLSETLAHKIEDFLDTPLIEIYGSTETGQIATRFPTQTDEWQLLPNVRLSAVDGRFRAEGGHVEFPAPLNDVIELTSDDRFLLQGRMQDIINIAGKRNSLASLNHHLNSIPGIIDGAFFMPDECSPDHVTRLSACVVAPTLTSDQILGELRKCVDAVFLPRPLFFVEALPRNSTGKLPRQALQQFINALTQLNSIES